MTNKNLLIPRCLPGFLLALLLSATAFGQATIKIDAAARGEPISRNLFGKFTEHLGSNVYQGAWAQIVVNPEFAPAFLWPNQEVLDRRL
jgi:alpha-N-arabinofuranosidase